MATQWEYRTLEIKIAGFWDQLGHVPETVELQLNALGRDGWEVVQAFTLAANLGRTDVVTFLFKRPLQ